MWMEERGGAINEERVPRGGRHRRRDARRRLPVLHRDARRRRPGRRRRPPRRRRRDAARRVARAGLSRAPLRLALVERTFHNVGVSDGGTQAIDRAASLLVRVVESERPLAVGELAADAGLPKSTTSRLLGALERQGLLARSGSRGGCVPGPVLRRYAGRDGVERLLELAAPALERLVGESGETVNLALPSPRGAEHVAQRDSVHFVGVTNWVGRCVPHHVAAGGKVFLAFGVVPLAAELERFTPKTIRDRGALERAARAGAAARLRHRRRRARARAGRDGGTCSRAGGEIVASSLDLGPDQPPHPRPHRAARAAPDRPGRPARPATRPRRL